MTVKELIVELGKHPEDATVVCYDEIVGPWIPSKVTDVDPQPLHGDEFNVPMVSFG